MGLGYLPNDVALAVAHWPARLGRGSERRANHWHYKQLAYLVACHRVCCSGLLMADYRDLGGQPISAWGASNRWNLLKPLTQMVTVRLRRVMERLSTHQGWDRS